MVSENFIGTSNLIPGSERFHGFFFAKSDVLNVMLYVYVHIIGGFLKSWYPQSPILIGFSIINLHFGVPLFLETPYIHNQYQSMLSKKTMLFIEFIPLTIRYLPSHPSPSPIAYGPVFVLSHIAETTILEGPQKLRNSYTNLFFGV